MTPDEEIIQLKARIRELEERLKDTDSEGADYADVIAQLRPCQLTVFLAGMQMFNPSFEARGTGRTFALLMAALIQAYQHPETTIHFVDHFPIGPSPSSHNRWIPGEIAKIISLFPKNVQNGFSMRRGDTAFHIRWKLENDSKN